MKNIAIVGVDGSGKTALMISWGWHCQHPDANGYYLSPDPNGGQKTFDYVCDEMERMRRGKWPAATTPDAVTKLDWVLGRKGVALSVLSFMDFGGELYRKAFHDGPEATMKMPATTFFKPNASATDDKTTVAQLRRYVRDCSALVILINLSDVINDPNLTDFRTRQMLSVVRCMMDIMQLRKMENRIALVFSQADMYAETLQQEGSLFKAYGKYLGVVAANHPRVALFAVSAVDKTRTDKYGQPVPVADFKAEGLEKLTAWLALKEVTASFGGIRLIVLVVPVFNIVYLLIAFFVCSVFWFRCATTKGWRSVREKNDDC